MSIICELENLVGRRYSNKELRKILKEIDKSFKFCYSPFNEDYEEEDEDLDYCLDIGCDRGVGSIFYLPTRKGNYYITEVGFEYGC